MSRRGDGSDQEDPGPVPGRVYVEPVGGPLDGRLLDVTGWSPLEPADGALLMSEAAPLLLQLPR